MRIDWFVLAFIMLITGALTFTFVRNAGGCVEHTMQPPVAQ